MIGLMIALGGCQQAKDLKENTAVDIQAQRTQKPHSLDNHRDDSRHRQAMLHAFDPTLGGSQGEFCRILVKQRIVAAVDIQPVLAASEAGNATCQHALGVFYENGNGVPRDIAKAQALYLKAAPNDPYAYAELGRMARDGVGGPVDFVKARNYFTRAGAAGVVGLGGLMEQGLGGARDVPGALKLYVETTQKHDDPAWQAMRAVLAQGARLDAAQVEKYNRLWVEGFLGMQRYRLKYSAAMRGGINHTGQVLNVKVAYRFVAGQTAPVVRLVESCGDASIDQTVVSVLGNLPMKDPYLFPPSEKDPDILSPIVLFPTLTPTA